MIDKKIFLELADVHESVCISIYIPESEQEKYRISLKNHLSEAEEVLSKVHGLDQREIERKLNPVRAQLENRRQWRDGSGTVIFIYGDTCKILDLSEAQFESHLEISNHLYLLPLAPLIHQDYQLYLMTLSAHKVCLYEASLESFKKSSLTDQLPQRIEEVVGSDVEQKSLQYRTGQNAAAANKGIFHGHGAGNDTEKKEEYSRFFREIDQKFRELTENGNIPLVLACVDYLFSIYQEVSEYHNLYPDFILGNHDLTKEKDLWEQARRLIRIWIKKDESDLRAEFHSLLNVQKASYQLETILPATVEGKVKSLVVNDKEDVFGRYNSMNNHVELDEVKKVNNVSLLNMAAVQAIKNGGKVFLMKEDQMPFKGSKINAIYRYNYQN